MSASSKFVVIKRIGIIALLSIIGGVLMAFPMTFDEWPGFGYAIQMRLLIGMIFGCASIPLALATLWSKPLLRAWPSMYLPPVGAGVLAAFSWDPDYAFFEIAMPLHFLTALITLIIIDDRDSSAGRTEFACARCRYDLRAATTTVCPECGWDQRRAVRKPVFSRRLIRQVLIWLPAAAVSCLGEFLISRGLLSLG